MSRRDRTPLPLVNDPPVGSNRREVLLGAGGLAAVAAVGGSVRDRPLPAPAPSRIVGVLDTIGTFDITACSWGASNSGSTHIGGGGGAGKANVQDFSFTKFIDVTSPKLFLAVVTGKHIPKATITFTGRRGQPAIVYELSEVLVTSISEGESAAEDRPTENVTLNFAKIKFTVDGEVAEFDIATNV